MTTLAVVTGGARGIGLAIVRALLEEAVVDEVVVWDREPAELSEAAVRGCDVTDEASVRAAYAELGQAPTVLVNNAGGGDLSRLPAPEVDPFSPFGDVDGFRRSVDLNLVSAHVVTSVVGPQLGRGSAICNTASIAGQVPTRLFAYGAAKAAMIHWTRSMALALAPVGVRVNAVAPGIIRTRLWEMLQPDREAYDAMIAATVPLGTDQQASDVADAVAFLCSARASQVTGQVIAVDGGISLGRRV